MTFREALKKDSRIYDLIALLMIGSYVLICSMYYYFMLCDL